MKSSVLKTIAGGIALTLIAVFMPFILVGAFFFLIFSLIAFRLFFGRRMRRAFATRTNIGLRRKNYVYDEENQVIYLSPKNFR